jgi:GDP-L-fucose synthase
VPLKLCITGGSGFIGRNLAELLASSYEISVPSRSQLDLLNHSAVADYLASHRFDVVIHSATGRSNRRVTAPDLFQNNCRMFFNLARNRHLFGRMLHFGSGAEFGVRLPQMPERFFDTCVPADDYAFAKYIASQFTESVNSNIYDLRLFGVFGKYEAWDVRFISNAICRTLHDLPIVLRQNVRFDYLYVNDLAKLTAWFIEQEPRYKTYNVCRGEVVELLSLAEIVAQISSKNPSIQVTQEGFASEYSGDNSRLMEEIGGFAFTPMNVAISHLYSWYEQHIDEIDRDALCFDNQ